MYKSFELLNIRRVFRLAFFFSIFFVFAGQVFFAQTSVSQTGIIMEKVADEDVKEVERLNDEAVAEDEAERQRRLSQQNETEDLEEDDSIDELFGDDAEGDTEHAVSTPTTEIVKIDAKNKPIEFSGNLKAELGAYIYAYPYDESKPVATFRNILKFIGRPTTDFFVYGSLLTAFPKMDFGIYELYFNYTMFGRADLSAGKRDISWSLSRMLNTNIIDEKTSVIVNNDPEKKKAREQRTTNDSKFTVSLTVPFLSYFSLQAVAQYETDTITGISIGEYISCAAKIEGTIKNVSVAFLAKRWATADEYQYDPCFGMEVVSTALGKNSNMFAQGLVHFSDINNVVSRVKWTTGIYKYFEAPIMLGLAFEYQGVWGSKRISSVDLHSQLDATQKETEKTASVSEEISQYEGFQHLFAAQIGWGHWIGGKKWTFGLDWFHDLRGEYGSITPGVQINSIIKYTDLKLAVPIYYGTQRKYGVVFEVILNLDY